MVKKTAVSLFAGAGGLDIGFARAGFDIRLSVELDPSCCKTLRANLGPDRVLEGDVSLLSGDAILRRVGLARGELDCLFGGPPCQSYSLAGLRRGLEDPRGQLVFHFVRLVRELAPRSFVMENVKGMANWQDGAVLKAIEADFAEPVEVGGAAHSYAVQHRVLDAVDFGAPQRRERIIVVGSRTGRQMAFPEPTRFPPDARRGGAGRYATIGEAILHLPPPDAPSATALRVAGTVDERAERHAG